MISIFWLALAGLVAAYLVHYFRCFARNLASAKQSGLPYIIMPFWNFNRFWLVTHRLWLPFLERLPEKFTSPWIQYLTPEWMWERLYEPFRQMGADVFILCAPGKNSLYVADPEAICQITARRNDFPKPIELYGSVDLFGKNVVSTEGSVWRHHRKITSPPFTEQSNHLVWQESLHQAKSMLASWVGVEGEKTATIDDVAASAMRLSLHVISRAGFGVRLLWPHEEVGARKIPEGHTLSYKDALSTLLENILWVMLMPRWLLKNSPLKVHKVAYESFVEWGKYMNEMYQAKKTEVKAGGKQEGLDLMGALVKGAGITSDALKTDSDAERGRSASKQLLTDEEILGNAFVFILAGHETAANTIHFSLLFLAMNPATQRHLQRDIDDIFGDKPISEWDYERDVPKL
ncbi:hypothetical protein LTR66_014625, partial [Elasticomyces elasticus]